jgi:UDPglucose 6-dehydrogenase
MKLTILGCGYVGLVSGAGFAELGHDVVCVDKDANKVALLQCGEIPIYEPGLDALVARGVAAGRLHFDTDVATAVAAAELVFIAVGTPTRRGDGHADLSYVFAAAREIATHLRQYAIVVTKSTVPVGTGARLQSLFDEIRPDLSIAVASNPEFLREGSAIEDFLRPDRVVCGVNTLGAREALHNVYRPLKLNDPGIFFTNIETAELIKYASNSFLAMKITFINEIADLCEAVGADVQMAAHGIGLDRRIGSKFLNAGPGYGGSCFPKDTLALLRTAEMAGVPQRLIETVVNVNEQRKRTMIRKVLHAAGGSVAGKTIGVLGVTFKPNTDDMRESPSLVIVPALQAEGAVVQAYDPEGVPNARALFDGVTWAEDAYAAVQGCDLTLLLTEWNQFRALDLHRVRQLMRGDVFVDLRNVYDQEVMAAAGLAYVGVGKGSGEILPTSTAHAS